MGVRGFACLLVARLALAEGSRVAHIEIAAVGEEDTGATTSDSYRAHH